MVYRPPVSTRKEYKFYHLPNNVSTRFTSSNFPALTARSPLELLFFKIIIIENEQGSMGFNATVEIRACPETEIKTQCVIKKTK